MFKLSLVFFGTIFITSAAAAVLKNYTITVPVGTSNHNDPNLLCTPTGWQDIITFYLGNYIAHVATVLTLPGESTTAKIKVSLAALFFPISGLMRGLFTILTFATFAKTDLQKAAKAGALCMVVRNEDWKPEPGDVVADAYIEDPLTIPVRGAIGSSNSPARVRVFDAPWSTLRTENDTLIVVNPDFSIHGSINIPASKGYDLAYVSGAAKFEDDFTPKFLARTSTWSWGMSSINNAISASIYSSATPTTVSSSYNIIGGLIALAQAIYTSVTLYQARGDQIDQYGYAAFGLTVAPFVLMSIINLIGNILAPNYPAIYMIETSVMEEAKRHGCSFDGVVGKLKEGRAAKLESVNDEVKWAESATFEKIGETNQLSVEIIPLPEITESSEPESTQSAPGERDHTESLSLVERGSKVSEQQKECRKFLIQTNAQGNTPEYTINIPSCPIIGSATSNKNTPRNLDEFTITTEKKGSEIKIARGKDNYESLVATGWLLGIVFGLVPLAIVGGLSHFKAGNSTAMQRGWTMSWLASGMVAGFLVAGATTLADKKDIKENVSSWGMGSFFFIFGATAIGGFVVVGQMVKEYGTCIALP